VYLLDIIRPHLCEMQEGSVLKWMVRLPGDPVVKNLPADAGDTNSIPDPGGSHMLQDNYAHVPLTTEPML